MAPSPTKRQQSRAGVHLKRLLSMFVLPLMALEQDAHADSWLRAETRHFVVYSNVGVTATRNYVEQLESFKHLAELILGADPKSAIASAKFTLYLFDDQDLLKTVRPSFHPSVAGVYLRCVEGAQAFAYRHRQNDIGGPDIGLEILQHEYAHHLMFSRMRRFYPSWYVEGFADYLSVAKLQRGAFIVGGNSEGRSAQLAAPTPWIEFSVMLDPKQFVAATQKQQINGLQYYAQSWVLTHYMLADSGRTQAFNAYFDRIGRGEDAISSFESQTGIPVAQLRNQVRAHWRKLPGLKVTVPNLPEADVAIERLPAERSEYILEAAALQTCPDEARGRELTKQLKAMRAKVGKDSRFRVELSRAELLFGDSKAARTELESLAQSGEWAFDVAYLLGRSYFGEAQRNPEQRVALMAKASAQFLKAYQIDKRYPPNLYFLSKSLDTEETPAKSVINAGTAAALLAPSVAEYAFHAAAVNLRSGDRETAVRVMQPFANNPHDTAQATRISEVINAIQGGKDLPELMAMMPSAEAAKKPEQ